MKSSVEQSVARIVDFEGRILKCLSEIVDEGTGITSAEAAQACLRVASRRLDRVLHEELGLHEDA